MSETYRDWISVNDKLDLNAAELMDAYITDGN
jgi:hypothetical protein